MRQPQKGTRENEPYALHMSPGIGACLQRLAEQKLSGFRLAALPAQCNSCASGEVVLEVA